LARVVGWDVIRTTTWTIATAWTATRTAITVIKPLTDS
jgi:hypothetical protein